jgi:hypothetical protein
MCTGIKSLYFLTAVLAIMVLYTQSACAYLGPGIGLSVFGAIGAVIIAILIAIAGILIWPIKAFIRKIKNKKAIQQPSIENETLNTSSANDNDEKIE